ncbi:RNA methyltransferase [Gordonia sinesedis]
MSERSARVVSYAKLHRAPVRREQGRFLVEGANAVGAALATDRAEVILVPDQDAHRYADIVGAAQAQGVPVYGLTPQAAVKLAETETPTGIFAVCGLLDVELADVLDTAPTLLAIAVEPREPGNAGTLIRTADAMGADAVLFLGDAVDPHNGKCVRASAGSIFHLPIVRERDTDAALRAVRDAGLGLLATAADGDLVLDEAAEALAAPTAWLFGNEAHGLPPQIADAADHRVSIPIRGRAESLNLAAAAAICLYESARVQPTRR